MTIRLSSKRMGVAEFRPLFVVTLLLSISQQVLAITFRIDNAAIDTPGGQRFQNELGNDAMINVLHDAQIFIEDAFSLSLKKDITEVTLHVESFDGIAFAYFGGDIHLSANHIENDNPGNTDALRTSITGILFHEMTHVLQNSNGAPSGVIEGVADYIRLKAGYGVWTRQRGGNWDDGYATTAFFFEWIDTTQISWFVNRLNQRLGLVPWDINFFVEITGKNVDTLWQEYQNSI